MSLSIVEEADLYLAHMITGAVNQPGISNAAMDLVQSGYLLPKIKALEKVTKPLASISQALQIIKNL